MRYPFKMIASLVLLIWINVTHAKIPVIPESETVHNSPGQPDDNKLLDRRYDEALVGTWTGDTPETGGCSASSWKTERSADGRYYLYSLNDDQLSLEDRGFWWVDDQKRYHQQSVEANDDVIYTYDLRLPQAASFHLLNPSAKYKCGVLQFIEYQELDGNEVLNRRYDEALVGTWTGHASEVGDCSAFSWKTERSAGGRYYLYYFNDNQTLLEDRGFWWVDDQERYHEQSVENEEDNVIYRYDAQPSQVSFHLLNPSVEYECEVPQFIEHKQLNDSKN